MDKNVIPPITDPLGRHWEQPSLDRILIDDTHAVMDKAAFWELRNYSSTIPTGVYPGKMWRAQVFLTVGANSPSKWVLRWFGEVEGRPDLCSNNQRDILVEE